MDGIKYRISDIMTCAIANMLEDSQTVFHGVSSHMPMIAIMLARAMHAPNLVHLNIPGGVNPNSFKGMSCSSCSPNLTDTANSYFPLADVFDLSMRGGLDVAFLSGVQFDARGNINASVIGDYHNPKVRLPGGAGSAVLIPTAKKCIIWRTKHDKRTFVENVDFVTARGNVWRIVTPLCIFELRNGKLYLESIHPSSCMEEVEENTGFEILCDKVRYTSFPTLQELKMLVMLDTDDYRSIEFK